MGINLSHFNTDDVISVIVSLSWFDLLVFKVMFWRFFFTRYNEIFCVALMTCWFLMFGSWILYLNFLLTILAAQLPIMWPTIFFNKSLCNFYLAQSLAETIRLLLFKQFSISCSSAVLISKSTERGTAVTPAKILDVFSRKTSRSAIS